MLLLRPRAHPNFVWVKCGRRWLSDVASSPKGSSELRLGYKCGRCWLSDSASSPKGSSELPRARPILRCCGWGDADGADAALVGLEHGQGVAGDLELLADERDAVHGRQDEPRDGLEVARWQAPVERIVQVLDPVAPGHPIAAIRQSLHHGRRPIMLVADLAHDLLDDVLDRHDADGSPVLVHHD